MSTQKSITNFKKVFCNTLKTDEKGNNYLKIPIANYQELSFFRSNIVDAIEMITDLQIIEENNTNVSDVAFTIKSLSQILKSASMIEECNGIDNLFSNS